MNLVIFMDFREFSSFQHLPCPHRAPWSRKPPQMLSIHKNIFNNYFSVVRNVFTGAQGKISRGDLGGGRSGWSGMLVGENHPKSWFWTIFEHFRHLDRGWDRPPKKYFLGQNRKSDLMKHRNWSIRSERNRPEWIPSSLSGPINYWRNLLKIQFCLSKMQWNTKDFPYGSIDHFGIMCRLHKYMSDPIHCLMQNTQTNLIRATIVCFWVRAIIEI